MTGAAIVVLCVFVFASGWLSCAAVRALAGDREDERLRARLPHCGMTAPDGSERRTCSCLGPITDINQLSLDLRTNRLRDLPARQLTEKIQKRALERMRARTGVEPDVVTLRYTRKDPS